MWIAWTRQCACQTLPSAPGTSCEQEMEKYGDGMPWRSRCGSSSSGVRTTVEPSQSVKEEAVGEGLSRKASWQKRSVNQTGKIRNDSLHPSQTSPMVSLRVLSAGESGLSLFPAPRPGHDPGESWEGLDRSFSPI